MKLVIFFVFIWIISNNLWSKKTLEYAEEYCDYSYPIYDKIDMEQGVSGIFVSKAIQYAGHSVMVWFEWVDENYIIPKGSKLKFCLS